MVHLLHKAWSGAEIRASPREGGESMLKPGDLVKCEIAGSVLPSMSVLLSVWTYTEKVCIWRILRDGKVTTTSDVFLEKVC